MIIEKLIKKEQHNIREIIPNQVRKKII